MRSGLLASPVALSLGAGIAFILSSVFV